MLDVYHLQLEMCSGEYVTALCSLMDRAEGFERLLHALFEIDGTLQKEEPPELGFVARMYRERKQVYSVAEAMERSGETVELA